MLQNKIHLQIPRAVIFIFTIVFLILGIKAYLWYFAIQETIKQNYLKYADLTTKLNYTTNFYIPYLKSDYAWYFVNHEHGFANDNEIIVKFIKKTQLHIPSVVNTLSNDTTWTIQWWWKEFFDYKIDRSLKW